MVQDETEAIDIFKSFPAKGMFLTGIENSDPIVNGSRRNQLREAHDFYNNYVTRLENIHSLGLRWIRFGIPYSTAHLEKGVYDFSFFDKVQQKCDELSIDIIADLMHFGLPDWMNSEEKYFQNKDFPEYFAQYAREFALRYPNIYMYTLINEPYITAFFSAKIGIWNEQLATEWHNDVPFVKAATNIARAVILAKKAVEQVWLEEKRDLPLIFVQNESFEIAHGHDMRRSEIERFNIRKFAILDLILGIRDEKMRSYLLSQGMSDNEYEWFMDNGSKEKIILGVDHYCTCVHMFHPEIIIDSSTLDEYQLYEVIKEYWNRYKLPMLHTEVNSKQSDAAMMCIKTYEVLNKLRSEGYPVLGMAWYGDEYQVGWQTLLVGYEEHDVGLFYSGKLTIAGETFRTIASQGLIPIDQTMLESRWKNQSNDL